MADVIGVGGSDGLDLAAGSGVGPQLEFLAPATEIECGTISGGASMATSIAAAVAALVVSVNPLLTRHEILRILRSTCEKIGPDAYVSERNAKCGWGRVNAAAAVHMAKVMRNRMGVDSPNV
jgi:subtilisin family serine protease